MVIDTIGVGGGVFDRMREQNFPVIPFVASESPSGPTAKKRFVNRRAEQWWAFRKMFERGEIDLPSTDEDSKLISQLSSIKYFIRSDGRILVESKEDMEARGLPSPDRADAAMMACVRPLPAAGEFIIPDAQPDWVLTQFGANAGFLTIGSDDILKSLTGDLLAGSKW
jgi:hypothetical protein